MKAAHRHVRSARATAAFGVAPAWRVSGLVTARGIAPATGEGLAALFPEQATAA